MTLAERLWENDKESLMMKAIKQIIYYAAAFSFFILLGSLFNFSIAGQTESGIEFVLKEPVFMLFWGIGLLGFAAIGRKVHQKKPDLADKKTSHQTADQSV